MESFNEAAAWRAQKYCRERNIELRDAAAPEGQDGQVYRTSARNYIKVFARPATYHKELEAYRRLRERRVVEALGFNVPLILFGSDVLGIIEISRVEPPFVLDFGKIELDVTPEEVWADDLDRLRYMWTQARGKFRPEQWPTVLRLYHHFGERYGIWMPSSLFKNPTSLRAGRNRISPRRETSPQLRLGLGFVPCETRFLLALG